MKWFFKLSTIFNAATRDSTEKPEKKNCCVVVLARL
jgi:hypothetical protein